MLSSLFGSEDDEENTGPPGFRRQTSSHHPARGPAGFVGLENQGATCYLNALLQTMFMTPDLRAALYTLTAEDLGVETRATSEPRVPPPLPPNRTCSPGKETDGDQENAVKCTHPAWGAADLEAMGFPLSLIQEAFARFPLEKDRENVLNWLLGGSDVEPVSDAAPSTSRDAYMGVQDDLYKERAFPQELEVWGPPACVSEANRHPLDGSEADVAPLVDRSPINKEDFEAFEKTTKDENEDTPPKRGKRVRVIPFELQRLFARLQGCRCQSISTEALTRGFGWERSEACDQHDVHELNRLLFDALETCLKRTPAEALVPTLYRGSYVNQVECLACHALSEREEEFSDVQVIVKGFTTLKQSLLNTIGDEYLKDENQYHCERCETKVDAKKGVRFRRLPPILIFSLLRFEYNFLTEERSKITSSLSFPLELDMHRFHKSYSQARLSPEDRNAMLYDLFSVVIHRGSAYSGHYHAYIRDFLKEGEQSRKPTDDTEYAEWYDFDDSQVTPISSQEIQKQFGGRNEGAYMLVYRRKYTPLPAEEATRVPDHLAQEVELHNQLMEEEAKRKDEELQWILVYVHTIPSLEALLSGRIRHYEWNEEKAETRHMARWIRVDVRWTLDDLKNAIFTGFGEDYFSAASSFHIHELTKTRQTFSITQTFLEGPRTLQDGEIYDKSVLLACSRDDAARIAELMEAKPLTLEVLHFKEGGVSVIMNVIMSGESTFLAFTEELSVRTGLPCTELYITMMDPSLEELVPLNPVDPMTTLTALGLCDRSEVGVERQIEGQSACLAVEAYLHRDTHFYVFVANFLAGEYPAPVSRISTDPGEVLQDLKGRILEAIVWPSVPGDFTISNTRLRRTCFGGGEGDLFPDESVTLEQADVEKEEQIIIEAGKPVLGGELVLRYIFGEGGRKTSEVRTLNIHRTSTIRECKEKIALALQQDPKKTRLSNTDVWDYPANVFGDEDATLEHANVHNNDTLWIERGLPPVKGQITLHVYRHVRLATTPERVQESNDTEKETEMVTFSSSQDNDKTTQRVEECQVYPDPLSHFEFLGDVNTPLSATVLEFKKNLMKSFPDFLDRGSPLLLRLRDLLDAKAMGRWFHENGRTLKKYGLFDGMPLCVEVLPEVEDITGSTGMIFTVRERIHATRTFGPAQQVIFDPHGPQPRLPQLIEVLSTKFEIAANDMEVIKFFPHIQRWRCLSDDETGESKKSAPLSYAAAVSKSLEGVSLGKNLKGRPYNLRDGDILCVRSRSLACDHTDDFTVPFNVTYTRAPERKGRCAHTREVQLKIKVDVDVDSDRDVDADADADAEGKREREGEGEGEANTHS